MNSSGLLPRSVGPSVWVGAWLGPAAFPPVLSLQAALQCVEYDCHFEMLLVLLTGKHLVRG